eukprot:5583790-Alexandrium_andersonii.AAC.1
MPSTAARPSFQQLGRAVDFADRPTFVQRGRGVSGCKVFVGPLPPGVTREHVKAWIARALKAGDWQEQHGRLTATDQ